MDDECCLGCGCRVVVSYTVGVLHSWVLSRALFPNSKEALVVAVVVTLPAFITVSALSLLFPCTETVWDHLGVVVSCVGGVSEFLNFIGIGLLTTTTTTIMSALSQRESHEDTVACGVFAVIFTLVATITNCVMLASTDGVPT